MTNMSCCAFKNTVDDMNQCVEKLKKHDYCLDSIKQISSKQEYNAAVRFISLCKQVFYDNEREIELREIKGTSYPYAIDDD